jgi:hypothetical protein
MAAARRNHAASGSINYQPSTLNLLSGQIHRTKNQS